MSVPNFRSIESETQSDINSTLNRAVSTTQESFEKLQEVVLLKVVDFRTNSKSVSELDYEKIKQHRMKYYKAKALHLSEDQELKNSHLLDSRSTILALEVNGEVRVSLRVTPRPFELENFDSHNPNLNSELFLDLQNYAELGRLVSDPSLDQVTAALLTRYILCLTGLKSFQEWGYEGFVAICRPFRLSYFKKFGLKEHFTVYSEQRKLIYHFLSASKSQILDQTSQLQMNESYLIKRLKQSFGDSRK
ncbi:MAG: hypothetical protein L6Q37_09395 [Bdellovibrionaceae bacterium]|nr:hypothetical protein [Pseudobdellovibrionaceae bacterium]NUM57770.1 hypothetical protein [Pseudobdellovibrionaceae bacterium]